jgi:hypothetical protein
VWTLAAAQRAQAAATAPTNPDSAIPVSRAMRLTHPVRNSGLSVRTCACCMIDVDVISDRGEIFAASASVFGPIQPSTSSPERPTAFWNIFADVAGPSTTPKSNTIKSAPIGRPEACGQYIVA